MGSMMALALFYKQYGYSYGKVISLGDGLPSNPALQQCGMCWPSGTMYSWKGHTWLAQDDQVVQQD